jgi:hypothetical protein
LKPAKFIIIAVLLWGLAGCAKRQTTARLIYIPAPPADSGSNSQGGAMVIEKPAPAEPAVTEAKPEPPPEPARVPPPRTNQRVPRKETPAPVSSPQRPAADAPKLETATSFQQQASIERNVNLLQRAVEARISRLSRLNLAGSDRKTLDDARTFVAQSQDAMKNGDLTQSSNLAQKANLLVQAIEKRH